MIDQDWQDLDAQLLIGTYTRDSNSQGIYHVNRDGEVQCVAEADNPSYLAAHPNLNVVYCVNETGDFQDEYDLTDSLTGAISAFKSDLDAGGLQLELISQQPSMGADPCHISVANHGEFLVVANYSGGTFASFPLDEHGVIESFQSITSHTGSGPVGDRQTSAHVHSTLLINDELFVADLGADRVSRYKLGESGSHDADQVHVVARAGAGPRFMVNNNTTLFVLNELDNTLVSYDLDTLTLQQRLSIVPESVVPEDSLPKKKEPSISAHLAISQDKRFLYMTNRGFDIVVVVKIEPELKIIQTISSGGGHPRHFSLLREDQYLVVANQDSNNLVAYQRNAETGVLVEMGVTFSVPCPTFVLPI